MTKLNKEKIFWLLIKILKEEDKLSRSVMVKMIMEELEK